MRKLLFILTAISLVFVSCKKEAKLNPADPKIQKEVNKFVEDYTLAHIFRDYDKAIEMTIDDRREYSIEVKKKGYHQEKVDILLNTGEFLEDKHGIRVVYQGVFVSKGDVARGDVVVALKRKGNEYKIYEYYILGKETFGKEHKSSKIAEMYNAVLDWAEASQKKDRKKMLSLCKKNSHWEMKTEVEEDAVYRIISLTPVKYEGTKKELEGKIEVTRKTGSVTRYLFEGTLEKVNDKLLLEKMLYTKVVQK